MLLNELFKLCIFVFLQFRKACLCCFQDCDSFRVYLNAGLFHLKLNLAPQLQMRILILLNLSVNIARLICFLGGALSEHLNDLAN